MAEPRRAAPIFMSGRRPTEEERELWRQVAKSLRRRTKVAARPPTPAQKTIAPPPSLSSEPAPPPAPPKMTLRPAGSAWPPLSAPSRPAAPASGLDRATETRLRKGRRAPDARLDLHGMTAMRAHAALIAFIMRSREAGHRCVLVITGKGGLCDGRPGVLRRETPLWLSAPPLAEMIVNVSPAHPRHGGGGALYVYLKRKRQR